MRIVLILLRVAILLLALLGGLSAAGLGYVWKSDALKTDTPDLVVDHERLGRGSYFLFAALPMALAGGALGALGRGKGAAALLFAAALAPVLFSPWALLVTSILFLAAFLGLVLGIASIFVRPAIETAS